MSSKQSLGQSCWIVEHLEFELHPGPAIGEYDDELGELWATQEAFMAEEKRTQEKAHRRNDMIVCFEKTLAESIHVEAKARAVGEAAIGPDSLPAAYLYLHMRSIGPFVKEHSSLTRRHMRATHTSVMV